MPYPSLLSAEGIVERAWKMIEHEGLEAFSMHKLARSFDVATPSLYRYYRNKAALIKAVNTETFRRVVRAIFAAMQTDGDAETRMMAVADAYRQYIHAYPTTYSIAFNNTVPDFRPDELEPAAGARAIQDVMAAISGEADSLAALRGAMALIHGFAMLELAGQFRRGGDLDAAFTQSMRAYLAGWGVK